MKHTATLSDHLPVTIRNLKITTRLRLHPEFIESPVSFAHRNEVKLVADVFLQTDFSKNQDDPDADERIKKPSTNIHLVRHGAIRLYAKPAGNEWLVHSIEFNPSMLIYEAKRYWLREGDLPLSLSMLKAAVTPLLAEPLDALHIIPGLEQEKPVAFWSLVDSELYIPGTDTRCLHRLSHPNTGPAEGVKKNRIQLGDEQDDCLIRFKKAKWDIEGPDGEKQIEGIRVRLVLKRRKVTEEFRQFSTMAKVADKPRLVSFTESSLDRAYRSVMSRMEGTCLPIPDAWLDSKAEKQKDKVTHAKAMALMSRLTSIPFEDIRAMDEEIRHPSDSTRKRLDTALPLEFGRLAPVPVATLFNPSMDANPSSGSPAPADNIDPAIADAYGGR